MNCLVDDLQTDEAVGIDETFVKINGKAYYIIIATGLHNHKVLGIRVSKTRTESDIRAVIDEAERNTLLPIKVITADAWEATQAMVKNLLRPIFLVIHRHKKPYDQVVIWNIHYTERKRMITITGMKTDLFKKRKTREIYYMTTSDSLQSPIPKKKGRRKGTKNGQGKKTKIKTPKKTRGRKGVHRVFTKGKRGYVKIDPYRKTVIIKGSVPKTVGAALEQGMYLFSRKYIQNNIPENINSVIQSHVNLSGPKTAHSLEERLRSFIIVRNNPAILNELHEYHHLRGGLIKKILNRSPLLPILQFDQNYIVFQKKGVIVN